jgi:putative tricarboxylic transport membrane protein
MKSLKKLEIIWPLIWIGLSLFVIFHSCQLQIGNLLNPRPGLMPFILGIMLFLISLLVFLKSFLFNFEVNERNWMNHSRAYFKKIFLVLGCLFAYAFLLEKLGYLLTTSLIFPFFFKVEESNSWRLTIISTILVVVGSYLLFSVILGIKFPPGITRGLTELLGR